MTDIHRFGRDCIECLSSGSVRCAWRSHRLRVQSRGVSKGLPERSSSVRLPSARRLSASTSPSVRHHFAEHTDAPRRVPTAGSSCFHPSPCRSPPLRGKHGRATARPYWWVRFTFTPRPVIVRHHFAANTDAPRRVPTGGFVFPLMNCIPLADSIVRKDIIAPRRAEALAPRSLICFSLRQSLYPIVGVRPTAQGFR